jgi:hypothetical protein
MTPPNHSHNNDGNSRNHHLPAIGQDVLVRHNGHECLAYRDSDGHWRDLHDGFVLQGEVKVLKSE